MENEQAKKNFLTKVGIVSVMALVLVFWFLNVKDIFKFNDQVSDNEVVKLGDLQNDFIKAIDKINQDLEKIKDSEDLNKLADSVLLESIISETNKKVSSTTGAINNLKEDEALASSTSESIEIGLIEENKTLIVPELPLIRDRSEEVVSNNCPAYINCMPTIGETRSCNIPPNCEGITQIAY